MNIRTLIDNSDYIVVFDTNVLLNIYRYSPEFTDFAMRCICSVEANIILPATVLLEYKKHYRSEFAKMKDRAKKAGSETEKQIEQAKTKILKTCQNLSRLQFPDIPELYSRLEERIDAVREELQGFFDERCSLDLISHEWDNTDRVFELVNRLEQSNAVLDAPSQSDIYHWCEEGERRYKQMVPPGFKDAKDKDGVRKYSDLIIWKEILRCAKATNKNVIFVTDDAKIDWWESENGVQTFHRQLIEEFAKTGRTLYPMVSFDFFNCVAADYCIEKTDAVDLALRMTDGEYCKGIAEQVYNEIENNLIYSGRSFIDTASAHIGSEGLEELDIIEHSFISAKRINRDNNMITYKFEFHIVAEGTSYEYFGRDDDTGEIIKSADIDHVFEGAIFVEVQREADIFLDFENDSDFSDAVVTDGALNETEYVDNNSIDWDFEPPGEFGNCPDCGCTLDWKNDGGNGFCSNCAADH